MAREDQLDALLHRLEELLDATHRGDAIDRALAAPARNSGAVSLRAHKVVRQFREEAVQGLIRLDTANQLLGLLQSVLKSAVKP